MGPYAGKARVPIHGVLYPRYTTVEELLGPSAAVAAYPAAEPVTNGHHAAQPAMKKRSLAEQAGMSDGVAAPANAPSPAAAATSAALQAAADAAAAAGMDPEAVAALQRKAAKRAKRESRREGSVQASEPAQPQPFQAPLAQPQPVPPQPQAQQPATAPPVMPAPASAPAAAGNAADAARIRAALGYTTAAGALPSTPATGGAASFGFGFTVAQQVEAETDAKIARIMARDSTKDGFVPRKVWVSGMPHEYSEEQVKEYWEFCGPVESVDLFTFKDSGRFNGTVNVTFKTQDGYEAALAAAGEDLEGRKLRVERCKVAVPRKGSVARPAGPVGAVAQSATPATPLPQAAAPAPAAPAAAAVAVAPSHDHVAYVGNIAFEATEEEIKGLFAPHGATLLRLHRDKKTGKPKGFAHVHFPDALSLQRSLAVDGTHLHDRALKVMVGQPPKKAA